MQKVYCLAVFLLSLMISFGQSALDKLTVEKIMRDPKWIGTSPSSPQWSTDGKTLYFYWNPEKAQSDSMYYITLENKTPVKASIAQKQDLVSSSATQYNNARNAFTYSKNGDVFFRDSKTGITRRVTETTEAETNPQFSFNDKRIVYNRNQNLFSWDISTGETQQLTNLRAANATPGSTRTGNAANRPAAQSSNAHEEWLKKDQLQYFEVLRSRKEKKDQADNYNKQTKQKELRSINIEDKVLQAASISPDGRFVSYRLAKPPTGTKTTIVPNYVTETGFTTDIPARTKVGAPETSSEFYIYDRHRDTVWLVKTDSIPGIRDMPEYIKDYPKELEERKKKNAARDVNVGGIYWSPATGTALLDIRSQDNKDRWLMLWDTATQKLNLVDRQHDEAWIGGPGIFGSIGWIDDNTLWYQSEATGYSHLYTFNRTQNKKTTLTTGNYEVQRAQLSKDKKYFYISTNEIHPGEQHFYRLQISTGKKERLTSLTGANQVTLSPDEKYLAILQSYSNKPWELYLQENKNVKPVQISFQAQSDEFKTYNWRDPALVTIRAGDGANVYARLYKPDKPHPGKPAVIFVHGAGYLQNAHKWWSNYFREYMFHNMLADNGYHVLDIDYRGSAGYGRDWRTGIYRHMGGKDLSDHVDAAKWLVDSFGVDPKRIGIYGGSYGGFITLMAMFNEPGVFAAGAALRPVTDWANYNHPYTSNILNEPFNDSLAYRRSSPLYFAEGLQGDLLICHGMVDVNVHYQDAVKLVQRLIELGKDNWELASYPMEDHGFIEPSSWTDEYKRIFKLFERVLKK